MPPIATTSGQGINRKDLKRPDEFVSNVTAFFDKVAEHAREVTASLVVLFLIGLGITYYMTHRNERSQEANNALYVAEQTYENELKAVAGPAAEPQAKADAKDKKAPNAEKEAQDALEAALFKKLDVNTAFAGTVQKYRTVIQTYPGTRAAFDAKMALGDLYYQHGSSDQAESLFQDAARDASAALDQGLAFYSLGHAQENAGKFKEAVLSYEKALTKAQAGLKGDLLVSIARCYELAHDPNKARETYDKITKELPESSYARIADINKSALH